MERIRLTKDEKTVLRLLFNGCGCPDTYPRHKFVSCVDSLERLGLAKGAWTEGHNLENACITPYGKAYMAFNPNLCNPIDWKWVIATSVAVASAVFAAAALFVACSVKFG